MSASAMTGTGSYSAADQKARDILRKHHEAQSSASSSGRKIDPSDVLQTLQLLPFPRNTERVSVRPEGKDFVLSINVGLTTLRGKFPVLSQTARKCPHVAQLLAEFCPSAPFGRCIADDAGCILPDESTPTDAVAVGHDATPAAAEDAGRDTKNRFTFTSITVNKNYAANAHRDANHYRGNARIIAVGDFTGGELFVTDFDKRIDIRNAWHDFDARELHGTFPFDGERFSVVYFVHTASVPKLLGQHLPFKAGGIRLEPAGENEAYDRELESLKKHFVEELHMPWPDFQTDFPPSNSLQASIAAFGDRGVPSTTKVASGHRTTIFDVPSSACARSQRGRPIAAIILTKNQAPGAAQYAPLVPLACQALGAVFKVKCRESNAWSRLGTKTGRHPVPVVFLDQQSMVSFAKRMELSCEVWEEIEIDADLERKSERAAAALSEAQKEGDEIRGDQRTTGKERHRTLARGLVCISDDSDCYGHSLSKKQRTADLPPLVRHRFGIDLEKSATDLSPSLHRKLKKESSRTISSCTPSTTDDDETSETNTKPELGGRGRAEFAAHEPTSEIEEEDCKPNRVRPPALAPQLGVWFPFSGTPRAPLERRVSSTQASNLPHESCWQLLQLVEPPCFSSRESNRSLADRALMSRSCSTPARRGSTRRAPLPEPLARLMLNAAKVLPTSMVLDPCAGEGTIGRLVAGGCLGNCFSADVVSDGAKYASSASSSAVLAEETRGPCEFVTANLFAAPFRLVGQYDAVVCDPPFGRREPVVTLAHGGASAAGTNPNPSPAVLGIYDNAFLPELFRLSARALKLRGRLVFLYPHYPKSEEKDKDETSRGTSWTPEDMLALGNAAIKEDKHQSAGVEDPRTEDSANCRWHLVGTAEQEWAKSSGHVMVRRLVVLEKQLEKRDERSRRTKATNRIVERSDEPCAATPASESSWSQRLLHDIAAPHSEVDSNPAASFLLDAATERRIRLAVEDQLQKQEARGPRKVFQGLKVTPEPQPRVSIPDFLREERTLCLKEKTVETIAQVLLREVQDVVLGPVAAAAYRVAKPDTSIEAGFRDVFFPRAAGRGTARPSAPNWDHLKPGRIQSLIRRCPEFCARYKALIAEEVGPKLLQDALGKNPHLGDLRGENETQKLVLLYQFPPTLRVKQALPASLSSSSEAAGAASATATAEKNQQGNTVTTDGGNAVAGTALQTQTPCSIAQVHADDIYGHQPGEINFWVPLVPIGHVLQQEPEENNVMTSQPQPIADEDTASCASSSANVGGPRPATEPVLMNTLWSESVPNKADWHPFAPLRVGEYKRFWGSKVRHFACTSTAVTVAAATVSGFTSTGEATGSSGTTAKVATCAEENEIKTRVSLDFRLCLQEQFDEEWELPGVVYSHERREMEFEFHAGRATAVLRDTETTPVLPDST
ncbi:unnamed protein product [Amoebophrya sp. A120]|nr:unnamed protein product [Amoebophrya sp. A120]|eukprot:GSA120T00003935001.1